jgi:hypothetical protein
MIQNKPRKPAPEPAEGKPVASGEEWLGRSPQGTNDRGEAARAAERRRLWERLSPQHRRLLRVLARALVLRQTKGRQPEAVHAKLLLALMELERVGRRIEEALVSLSSGASLTNRASLTNKTLLTNRTTPRE